MTRCWCGFLVVIALASQAHAADASDGKRDAKHALLIDADGRTMDRPPDFSPGGPVIVIVRGEAASFNCYTDHPEAGTMHLKYRWLRDVVQPYVLDSDPADAPSKPGLGQQEFTIPGSKADRFLVFNLWQQQWSASVAQLQQCAADLTANLKSRDALIAALAPRQKEVDVIDDTIAELQTRAQVLQQQMIPLQTLAIDRAVQRLIQLQQEFERVTLDINKLQAERAQKLKAMAADRDVLARYDRQLLNKFKADPAMLVDRLTDINDEIKNVNKGSGRVIHFVIRKVAGELVGRQLKAMYYDFATRTETSAIGLSTLGRFPIVNQDDAVFAVLANLVPRLHPYPFFVDVSAQGGAAVNTAPARPVFSAGATGEAAIGAKTVVTGADDAYTDVILPIRGEFAPNDILSVTIKTERPDDKDPKKRTEVVLIDKAKYPQVRALYRFNFNTGIVRSWLRDRQFVKVKTIADDPGTEKVNEARYRIDEVKQEPRIAPLFAFTYYLKPVDIRGPVTHERYIPNPTLGFALTHPADDVFAGFSHEIFRNAQLFYGLHFGLVADRLQRNDINEDQDATDPPTRKVRQSAFTFGLTFNLNIVAKIFK